jgi:DNA replication initiation complex subunit (GINS family)
MNKTITHEDVQQAIQNIGNAFNRKVESFVVALHPKLYKQIAKKSLTRKHLQMKMSFSKKQ